MQQGASFIEYFIDDFIMMGTHRSYESARNMSIMNDVRREIGTLVEEDKSKGPTTVELCFGAIYGNLGYVRKLPLMATCCLRKLPKVASSQQVA